MGQFADLFDEEKPTQQRAAMNLRFGIEAQPDVAARDQALARRFGLPPAVIEQYRPDYAARAAVADAAPVLEQSPKLRGWLADDAQRARVAHDDVPQMGAIEAAVKWLVSAPDAPRGGLVADVFKAGRAIASGAPSASAGLYGAAAAPFEVLGLDTIGQALRGQQKNAQAVADSVRGMSPDAGFMEQSLMSGFQSAGQNLIMLPFGLAAKTPNLMLGIMGAVTGGQSYGKGRDAGLDPAQAAAFGIQDATAEIVTERFLGAAGFLKNIKAGASAGKLFGYEVFKEVPGEIGATLWQNFNEWANVNPDKSIHDFLSEQPAAIAQTIIATLVGGSVQIGAIKGIEAAVGRAQMAEQHGQALADVSKLIEASKLRQRDPEAFATFAQSLTEEGVSSLYVDARALQQSGVDLQALAQAMPSVAAQLQQAVATGGDVVIPTAEFLTQAPGQEWSAALIDHARTAADAMSPAGAREYMQAHGEQLQEEIARTIEQHATDTEWQAGRDAVRADFHRQLDEVGRWQPEVNRQYAALLGDYYAATAARAGMTPQELAERYPLRIQAKAAGGAVNAMEQAGPVVYRGRTGTGPLRMRGGVAYFTDNRAAAESFPRQRIEEEGADGSVNVMEARLNLRNPASEADIERIAEQEGIDLLHPDYPVAYLDGSPDLVAALKAAGYDGAVGTDGRPDNGREIKSYAVFDSSTVEAVLNQSARLPATIDIDGHQRPTTNSKGQQIAATEEGVQNFWKWFGDSKVVDAEGRPLVVYHGTDRSFAAFDAAAPRSVQADQGASGFYLTRYPEDASGYASGRFGREGANVIPAYVSLQNPYVWPADDLPPSRITSARREELEAQGFDGIVYRDGEEVVAFRPEQIKSAIGNRGTFDPNDASILNQNARAQISFGQDITQQPSVISLFDGADLSSLIHEAGHFFLEAHMDLAGRIAGRIADGEQVSDGERGIVADANALLGWFGVQGDEAAGGAGGGALEQPAYHGTPHRGIDKFSTDKIGTGEGAQAYGWGLYFAGKKEIAEWYREKLAGEAVASVEIEEYTIAGDRNWIVTRYNSGGDRIDRSGYIGDDEARVLLGEAADSIFKKSNESPGGGDGEYTVDLTPGQLYSVEIPDDSEMLLWDRPLSEQPAKAIKSLKSVREALTEAGVLDDYLERKNADWEELTGQDVYEIVKRASLDDALPSNGPGVEEAQAAGQDDKAASLWLWNEGLAGIKYLDGTSRSAGDGSYNYVIFSGDDTQITGTFYQGGQPDARPEPPALGRTPLETWAMMSIDQKRAFHEQFARGFELYAIEGKAPSLSLQSVFQRFSVWLKNVYRSITQRAAEDVLQVKLTDEVRQVMDRMIATDEQIAEAQAMREMGPLFGGADQAGMTPEQWAKYHELAAQATAQASEQLQARGLRDMQWLRNARSRELKRLQARAAGLRREVEMEVRRDVLSMPIYRAWQFLTTKGDAQATAQPTPRVRASGALDPASDNLFTAIAKLGGLDRAEVVGAWGVDPKDRLESGVFGAPVLRKENGLSIDAMAEKLAEEGYLLRDENGRTDPADLEAAFDSQRRGVDQYSTWHDMAEDARVRAATQQDAPEALPDEIMHGKLDTAVLRDMYGTKPDALWRTLSDRRMTSEAQGIHPEVVAETFWYDSADALVRALAAADPPRQVIEGLTDQRMLERYGDLATPEGLQREADKAIHNEARARAIATELDALERMGKVRAGEPRTADVLAKAARDYAAAVIGAKKVRDIRPGEYTAAEARASKAAQKAFKAGDTQAAATEKRHQLIQHAAAKAALQAREEVERIDQFFRRVVSGKDAAMAKTRDLDIVNAARAVLAPFGYGAKAKTAGEYLKAVQSYDPALYEVLGESVAQAETLAAETQFKSGPSIMDLPLERLRALHDEIASLWHLARRARRMEIDGAMLDRQDVADQLMARMEEIGIPEAQPGGASAVTPEEERAMRLASLKGVLRRVESWVDAKDGSRSRMGPFRRFLFTPIKEAADAYRSEKAVYLRRFRDTFAAIAPTMKRGAISAPELGYTFGKDSGGVALNELLHALLHTGNESNKRKLLLGRGWAVENQDGSVDTRRWDTFVARMIREGALTRDHFDFAQQVWDLLEETKPLAQKTHRDAYGKYFDEVTADSFTVNFADGTTGTYRGGYVPAQVDGRIVKDNELKKLVEEGNDGMAYAFPGANKGFTKSRVEYNRPLVLDLRTLPQHIDRVLLFSHMEMPVRDAAKLLGQLDVSAALNKQEPAAISSMLMPWLNRSVRQQVTTPVPGAGWMMRMINTLRNRTGMAAMFANISNAAQQITGFSLAAVKVRPGLLLSATADYLRAPRRVAEEVADMSLYMRNRMSDEVSAMMGEVDQILLDPSLYERAQDWTKRHTYFMQSAVDNVMGPIIWRAAFAQAQEEGHSTDDARRLADSAVRQTQGSNLPEDVSRIETGPAYARIFMQFAGYFNMQANLLGTELGKVTQEMGLRKGLGRGLFIMLAGFAAPAIVAEAIAQAFRGGPGDDDKDGEYLDDWLMALLVWGPIRNLTAFVPFVGQAINSAVARFNANPNDDKVSTAPVVGAIEGAAGVLVDLYKTAAGEGNAQRTVKDVATLISITTGLPASVAARPVGYVAGVMQDEINPTSAGDAARGLATGAASPGSR